MHSVSFHNAPVSVLAHSPTAGAPTSHFLKSLRAADFELYVDALLNMLPWFFAMNRSNYARWLPVHLRDMRSLDQMVPDVAAEFKKGLFTVNKTAK